MSAVADPIGTGSLRSTASGILPPVPESLEELAIPQSIVEQLMLKYLYFRGELLGREMAGLLGLTFSLIDELLETLKRQHYVGVRKSLGMGNMSGDLCADRNRTQSRARVSGKQSIRGTRAGAAVSIRGGRAPPKTRRTTG